MAELSVAVASKDELGECPRWHSGSQTLCWLDIPVQKLHRWSPATGQHRQTTLEARVSAYAFRRDGGFLFAAGNSLWRADEDGRFLGMLASVDLPGDARFNDGAADAGGRFWVGALNAAKRHDNSLYCFESGALRAADAGIGASNGLAWSSRRRHDVFRRQPAQDDLCL